MPSLDRTLDVVIADDGRCMTCGEPSATAYCPECVAKIAATAGSKTVREHKLDPLTHKLAARPDRDPKLLAKQELARRELARRTLLGYIMRMFPGFDPGWFHADLAARLDRFLERVINQESPRLILSVPPRHGKACGNNDLALTPEGYRRHGDLSPGDEVFGPDGKPRRVVAVYPEIDDLDYEVEFTNGQVITCHANHEWSVYDRRKNANNRPLETVETHRLAEDFWIGPRGQRGGRARWQLPDVRGVDFPEAVLPLHPYVLGAWLGDGTHTVPCLTNSREDADVLQAAFAEAGYACTHEYTHADYGTVRSSFYRTGLLPQLKALGVFADKHVPAGYLHASRDQRRQLLAGLIDTDGHVEPGTGRVRYVTTSPRLRDAVVDLATTLGYRPYVTEQAPEASTSGIEGRGTVYTVGFQPFEQLPTRVPRKQIRKFAVRRLVGIRDIRRVAPKRGRCITVDHPDGLYLVGKQLIPTHNSIEGSQYFPAYALGRYPHLEFITTSHTLSLALDFSRKTRALIQDDRHTQLFPGCKLDMDNRNAAGWKTETGGGYFPAGVGGAIVGRGAHILIIDDPLKNAEEAASATTRESIWSWFKTTAYTRLAPGGGVLVIMQRWHLDDPAGRMIRDGKEGEGDVYEVVEYPAIADRDEYRLPSGLIVDYPADGAKLLRRAGEALHPPRWPLTRLEAIKRTLSPYEWSALYQQRPVVGENALFEEDMFVFNEPDEYPERLSMYSTNDLAIGQKQHHDWTVSIAFGVDEDDDIWVVDMVRGRFDALELVDMMIDVHLRHKTLADGIERSQIQMSIGPFFEKRREERKVSSMNIVELSPGNRDKVARSRSIQGRCRQRKVHLPKNAPWLQSFLTEITSFPVGQHDDMVDAFCWIGLMLDETDVPRIFKKRDRRELSWTDKVKKYQRASNRGGRSWKTV